MNYIVLLIYQENGRYLAEVGQLCVLPFGDAKGADVFVLGGDAGCDAEARLRSEGCEECLKHFLVSVGSLDEELRLPFCPSSRLEHLELLRPVSRIDRQIAIKGKALPAKPAAHHGHYHAVGPHQGNNSQAFSLGDADDVSTRIGNGRTACFADDADGFAFPQRLQILAECPFISVLAHLEEGGVVDGKRPVSLPQEATGRADVLDDEVTDAHDDLMVVGWQDLLDGSLAKSHRNEVQGCGHLSN